MYGHAIGSGWENEIQSFAAAEDKAIDPVNEIPLSAAPHISASPDECEHYEWEVVAVLWGSNAEIRKCLTCGHEWQARLR